MGAFFVGIASNQPGPRGMLLRLRLAGAVPGVGECHFAFSSDCCPRSLTGGMFVAGDEVPERGREAACSTLAREWKGPENVFVREECSGMHGGVRGVPPVSLWVVSAETVCWR